MLSRNLPILALTLLLSSPALVQSAEVFWQSGGSNNWFFTKNWRDGSTPGAKDMAIFNERSEIWAGPSGSQTLEAGAIVVRGPRTAAAVFQPFKGSAAHAILRLHGVGQSETGAQATLLISNQSAKPLVITNREENASLSIELAASGIIDASGPISIGSAIVGEHSLTKRGAGALSLGDRFTTSASAVELPGSTFTGGFVLEEGTLSTFSSSRFSEGRLLASPFGLGTLHLKGGTLKSQSNTQRTYHNALVIEGTVNFGPGGGIRFSKRDSATTTFSNDSKLNIEAEHLTFEQPTSGNYRITKVGKGALVVEGDMSVKELIISSGELRVSGRLTCERLVIEKDAIMSGSGEVNCPNIVKPLAEGHPKSTFNITRASL